MLAFQKIEIQNKRKIDECTAHYNYHFCEHCFTDIFIWKDHYHTQFCIEDGFLFLRSQPKENAPYYYLAPIGEGDLGAALDKIEADAAALGVPFRVYSVAKEMIPRIEEVRPGRYQFTHEDEDGDDYIYRSEKLQSLSGKKLQSKRNFINRFLAAHEGHWTYEPLTPENTADAYQLHLQWCERNGCGKGDSYSGETCAIALAFRHFEALQLMGGILRLDGRAIAFTFGCRATDDMIVVQVEKADSTVQGAYQMINQQFVKHNGQDVLYINREEDMGMEGLRKAKQSYYPDLRGVKYIATRKEEF